MYGDIEVKMKKIIGCLLMTLLVFSSIFSLTTVTSAKEEKTEPIKNKNVIYFKVPTNGKNAWGKSQAIYCHIWETGGGEFYIWQAKSEKCEKYKDDVWYYDLDKLKASTELEGGLKKGRTYAVIFSDNIGNQTYDLYFNSDCVGDLVVCTGKTQSNPVSPGKFCSVAEWKDNKDFNSVVYDKTPPSDQKPVKANPVDDSSNLSKEMGFAVIAIVASVVLLLALAFVITSAVKKRKFKEE